MDYTFVYSSGRALNSRFTNAHRMKKDFADEKKVKLMIINIGELYPNRYYLRAKSTSMQNK